jgi:meso-butanediol dehydrogenase/(S,S)-butanediol dehydrogenase/diacetyl reductase
MRFKNKTVFITGAAGGIGRQTGLSFAKEGANIVVTDLDYDMAKRVSDEIQSAGGSSEPFKLDVTKQDETIETMNNAYKHFGSLDVAFCNAGIREIVSPIELSIEEWRKVIDINVTGVFITAQTFAKHCIDNKTKGNIVITSSTLSITSAPNRCAYTASKHATAGMTKQLAMDLAKYDIRVNAVGPGVIRTPLTERYFQDEDASEKVRNLHAMKRWGEPNEISSAVLYLASEEASFCTGTNLIVDGGWTAGKDW